MKNGTSTGRLRTDSKRSRRILIGTMNGSDIAYEN